MRHTFTLFAPSLAGLPELLRSCFVHPWVASYQVGFGPPLVGSSDRLREAARVANGALEKLDAYFRCCILPDDERRRLASLHRRLVVRRLGPVEAETLDQTYGDALDLRLRLRRPDEPPPGWALEAWRARWPHTLDPALDLEGRFLVRLDDPRGERLLHHQTVAAAAAAQRADAALELRVAAVASALWSTWLEAWSEDSGYGFIELGRPLPHARQVEDGRSL